jgi:Tol biopolymer transport system component
MHIVGTRSAARAAVSISLAGACVLLVGLALVSSASASSRIAFVKGNSRTTIWTVAASGKDLRQLTKGKRYDFAPAWSPKRGMIAFVQYPSASNHNSQLWLMRADGTHQRRLTYSGPSLTGTGVLAYSSNGRLLAGGCKLAGQNKWAITVLNLKTRKSHIIHRFSCQLFDGAHSITWSPNSRQLFFTFGSGDSYDVFRIDVVHKRLIKDAGLAGLDVEAASWRPDGKYLLCSVWAVDDTGSPYYTCLVEPDGTKVATLGENQRSPVYSPDGSRYAFFVYGDAGAELECANADGSAVAAIVAGKDQFLEDAAWK